MVKCPMFANAGLLYLLLACLLGNHFHRCVSTGSECEASWFEVRTFRQGNVMLVSVLKDGNEILVDGDDPTVRKAAQEKALSCQRAVQDQRMADQLWVSMTFFIISVSGSHYFSPHHCITLIRYC